MSFTPIWKISLVFSEATNLAQGYEATLLQSQCIFKDVSGGNSLSDRPGWECRPFAPNDCADDIVFCCYSKIATNLASTSSMISAGTLSSFFPLRAPRSSARG